MGSNALKRLTGSCSAEEMLELDRSEAVIESEPEECCKMATAFTSISDPEDTLHNLQNSTDHAERHKSAQGLYFHPCLRSCAAITTSNWSGKMTCSTPFFKWNLTICAWHRILNYPLGNLHEEEEDVNKVSLCLPDASIGRVNPKKGRSVDVRQRHGPFSEHLIQEGDFSCFEGLDRW